MDNTREEGLGDRVGMDSTQVTRKNKVRTEEMIEFIECLEVLIINVEGIDDDTIDKLDQIIVILKQGERNRLFKQRLKSKVKANNKDNTFKAKAKQLIRKMIYQTEDYYKNYL